MHFILSHVGYIVGASALATGFIIGKLHSALPDLIKKEEGVYLGDAMKALARPEDKAALKAVLVALQARFPDAGSAIFAQAADACIKRVPALAPYRSELIQLFQAVEQAAKDGLSA